MKQFISIIYTLEKKVFAAATCEDLWVHSVSERVKKLVYTLVWISLFHISREDSSKEIILMRSKFRFLSVDI